MRLPNLDRIRPRLTYANVMVTVLAFVVIAGGTAAAALVITSNSQVGRDTISGHKPPHGDHPNLVAGSVNSTDLAQTSFHNSGLPVDGSGNCGSGTFTGWKSLLDEPVRYYRDLQGRVYLQGFAERCGTPANGDTAFHLPAGFRPGDAIEAFPIVQGDGTPALLEVLHDGDVDVANSQPNAGYSLNGVSFRCGPSGQNGCP
jgi:hypothetical protein